MQSRSLKGKVNLGTQVIITNKKFLNKKAKVLYIGQITDQTGEWIGVELLKGQKGNHSGDLKGKSYFTTSVPGTGIFVRAKDATLSNGKPLSQLVESGQSPQPKKPKPTQTVQTSKFGLKKDTKIADKQKTTTGITKAATIKKQEEAPKVYPKKQKLQTQLQNIEQTQKHLQKIQQLQKQIKQLKQSPVHKIKEQNEQLMAKLKAVQQENHNLKMTIQRKSNEVQPERENKLVELNSQIVFYKKLKEQSDRQKKKLQNKIAELNASLDQNAENQDIILKLGDKIEHLESKNESMRTQLQTTKIQLKKIQTSGGGVSNEKSQSILNQQISILNQTIILLESQAKEDKDKIDLLEKQIETNSSKLSDFTAIQRKLKQKEREVAQLKQSVDQQVDAINFVEQLSLTKLRIEEELKASKERINDLLNEKDLMDQNQIDQEEILRQLQHQITERDIQIQQYQQRVKDKEAEINDKVKQIGQYKDRITQLLKLAQQNNNLAQMKAAREAVEGDVSEETNVVKNNNHLLDIIKFSQSINNKFIKLQNESILVRNKAGVFLMNLFQALPQQFVQQFYPQAIDSLILVKAAKDKSFYLFEWICTELRQKNELYTDENSDLTNWMLLLLTRLQRTYYNLLRVDLLISNCETEEELGNIITHRGIRDQSVVIDAEISDLMNKFAQNSASSNYAFDRVDHCNEQLQKECAGFNKTMSKDNETKLQLCRLIMDSLNSAYTMILSYRILSDLRQNSQIDVSFDNYLKKLKEYLKEICLNNHFRFKPKMKNLLDDIMSFKETFKLIEQDDKALLNLQNITSSDHEALKVLKECILSSQSILKDLFADLNEIQLTDELQKIQGKLQGSVWGTKVKSMKEELLRVRQLVEQKATLQFELVQHKKKIIIQEKQIKDKIVVKDVLEKRIGQLQLKAEEVTVLKNDKERLEVKIKSVEENNKIMEEEIQNLIKKKSMIEEENKKIKESSAEQTTQKANRTSLRQTGNMSFAMNSIPVQNLLKQNSNLRNVDLKQKVSLIKFSDVMKIRKQSPIDKKKPIRKNLLETMVNMKIVSPFEKKTNNPQLQLQKLYVELDKVNEEVQSKKEVKLLQVGTVRIWGGVKEAAGNTISVLGYSEMRNILPDLIKS